MSKPNRRSFLQTAAVTAAMGAAAHPAAADDAPAKKGKVRVGCLSWCFHDFGPVNTPAQRAAVEQSIDTIGELGFDGIELILTTRGDITGYWTDETLAGLN